MPNTFDTGRSKEDIRNSAKALAMGAGQGATFGLGNKGLARTRAALGNLSYEDYLAQQTAEIESAKQNNPNAYAVGEMAGSVLPFEAGARVVGAGLGKLLGSRTAPVVRSQLAQEVPMIQAQAPAQVPAQVITPNLDLLSGKSAQTIADEQAAAYRPFQQKPDFTKYRAQQAAEYQAAMDNGIARRAAERAEMGGTSQEVFNALSDTPEKLAQMANYRKLAGEASQLDKANYQPTLPDFMLSKNPQIGNDTLQQATRRARLEDLAGIPRDSSHNFDVSTRGSLGSDMTAYAPMARSATERNASNYGMDQAIQNYHNSRLPQIGVDEIASTDIASPYASEPSYDAFTARMNRNLPNSSVDEIIPEQINYPEIGDRLRAAIDKYKYKRNQ